MLATMETYRPQNLNVYVKPDAESDYLVEKRYLLRLDRVVQENRTP